MRKMATLFVVLVFILKLVTVKYSLEDGSVLLSGLAGQLAVEANLRAG